MWHRYVAIGDSLTEGIGEPAGDGVRGWAPRLAEVLRTQDPDLVFHNLAFRGRVTRDVTRTQQARALELEPDLVTVLTGGNDVLFRPLTTRESLRADVTELVAPFAKATLVMGSIPDFTRAAPWFRFFPWGRTFRERLHLLNDVCREVATEQGAIFVDLWAGPYVPTAWSIDRLHPSAEGHRYIAVAIARALGLPDPPEEPRADTVRAYLRRSGREAHFLATKFFNDPDGRTLRSRIRPNRSATPPGRPA